jgi:hypothetical protein
MRRHPVQFLHMTTGHVDAAPPATPPTPARLFELLWRTLSEMLGSATTATLLRRSVSARASRSPGLAGVRIQRQGLQYGYTLPASWTHPGEEGSQALRDLIAELRPVLMELTGALVLKRLDAVPEFRDSGIIFAQ